MTSNDVELILDELVFEPAVAAARERLKRNVYPTVLAEGVFG